MQLFTEINPKGVNKIDSCEFAHPLQRMVWYEKAQKANAKLLIGGANTQCKFKKKDISNNMSSKKILQKTDGTS